MSETRSFAHESDFVMPLKIRVGVLGQHEDGGSEYLIKKLESMSHFEKDSIFRQNTLENVTERYL